MRLNEDNSYDKCFAPDMDYSIFRFVWVGDCGDTLGLNPNDLLPETSYVTNFIKNALINHGRAVLFHGHAHFMPEMQEVDKLTNFTDHNGFPSLAWAAHIGSGNEFIKDTNEGYGYLVDVYDDCIVLNG